MKLKECCTLLVDGNWIESKDQSESGIRLVQTGNIGNGEYLEKENRAKYISEDTFNRLKCTEIFPGDILVSRLPDPVGRACLIPEKEERMITAVDCSILRVNESKINKRYLLHFLKSSGYYQQISEKLVGTTRLRISRKNLEQVKIKVPDKSTQEMVAIVIDMLENIIELRKQELRLLDDLIKARFVEMFGDPEFNTKAWPTQLLDKLCNVGSSKRIYQNEQSKEGIPFWRISDLVSKMDSGIANSGLFIPEDKYMELKEARLVPVPGDILVTSRGTLGRCYIITDEDRFYFQDGMISWLSDYVESITPLYLQYLFMMPGFRKQIDNIQAGSTVSYLSIAMLKKLQIMVPSKDTQEVFSTFVTQVDKTKAAVQKALDEAQLLFDSLMQQYFG